jgi:hypothetical protein
MSDAVQWVREAWRATKVFRCPCCKYKTLHGRGYFEVCQVCGWEDDGQDEADAERVLGEPQRRVKSSTRTVKL